ncbi:MAG: hypothetical protein FJ249_01845 [Nitrospira sp.]|nr:hypothetical protein [Nitrospira sp.]
MKKRLKASTREAIQRIFDRLDYMRLGPIYCDEGGEAFWNAKRGPCQKLGIKFAQVLLDRLKPEGRSLYVGAGVAELPILTMEVMDLHREVTAYNLRKEEVAVLNKACQGRGFRFLLGDAVNANRRFDHLWIVSTLNDPERFPELSALSYGRADPATFDPAAFGRERKAVRQLADHCLGRLILPGLVTTSVEEIPWITDWCAKRGVPCEVEEDDYPTAIVEDPICFIRIGCKDSEG